MGLSRKSALGIRLHRIVALLCAVLVFALGLCAASPLLHKQVHAGDHGSSDDRCAIELFATGTALPVVMLAPTPIWRDHDAAVAAVVVEVLPETPRYLLQPERGPPAV